MESWIEIKLDSDFSLYNLPFGIITTSADSRPHAAVAAGDSVVDLKVLSTHCGFSEVFASLRDVGGTGEEHVFAQPTLNAFAALGRTVHRAVRATLQGLLRAEPETAHPNFLRDNATLRAAAVLPRQAVTLQMPMAIGDYTDFYAGVHHARTAGTIFRGPDKALVPNYAWVPVAYHGRASSVVLSGTGVKRPWGQILAIPRAAQTTDTADRVLPTVEPTRKLDFELELGCFVARPNSLGMSVSVDSAEEHIFGFVLLNDWSARDIQSWEYVPLGPFNGKNFMTTISPWVVLADALAPFQVPALAPTQPLLPYLNETKASSVFSVDMTVALTTSEGDTTTITRVSASNLQWSFSQMIAHHTLGGCNLRTGDLLGSGTISGTDHEERGSLLEMSQDGSREVQMHGMNVRKYLEDGDMVTIRASASLGEACGHARVGFGECSGRVYSADQKIFSH